MIFKNWPSQAKLSHSKKLLKDQIQGPKQSLYELPEKDCPVRKPYFQFNISNLNKNDITYVRVFTVDKIQRSVLQQVEEGL